MRTLKYVLKSLQTEYENDPKNTAILSYDTIAELMVIAVKNMREKQPLVTLEWLAKTAQDKYPEDDT